MVYLPTLSWFFMVNVGKYTIHGSGIGCEEGLVGCWCWWLGRFRLTFFMKWTIHWGYEAQPTLTTNIVTSTNQVLAEHGALQLGWKVGFMGIVTNLRTRGISHLVEDLLSAKILKKGRRFTVYWFRNYYCTSYKILWFFLRRQLMKSKDHPPIPWKEH